MNTVAEEAETSLGGFIVMSEEEDGPLSDDNEDVRVRVQLIGHARNNM